MKFHHHNPRSQHWAVALEDAVVTFLIVFAGLMIKFQGIPPLDALWTPFWSALLMAVYSWARVRGIQHPPPKKTL